MLNVGPDFYSANPATPKVAKPPLAQQVSAQPLSQPKAPGVNTGPSFPQLPPQPSPGAVKPMGGMGGGMPSTINPRPQLSRNSPFLNYGSVSGGRVIPNANPTGMPPGFMAMTNPQNWGGGGGGGGILRPQVEPQVGPNMPLDSGPSQGFDQLIGMNPYAQRGGFTGATMPTPQYDAPPQAVIPNMNGGLGSQFGNRSGNRSARMGSF